MTRCQHCNAENADDARFCGACGNATSPTAPSTGGAAHAIGAAPEMVGREIAGRYRVLAKLGEGGMGAVYRGEQMSLKRKVAIKLLHPELSADAGLLRRFNAEAEAVAKLSHPNTINIFDFGQDTDGTLFIAMEYLEGKSLRQVLAAEGPMPPRRALHIATQIAASIADAHGHGIVHRDLKPDNVMLTERGRAKDIVRVLDFGIAKLRDEQNKIAVTNPMTRAGDLVGTPQYMAPEQIRGEEVDGRTDVYALGAILYEMVTGRLVFEGPSLMAILSRHLLDTPEPPTRRRPDLHLPEAIDGLVLSMLAKEPGARLPSMEVANERIAVVAMTVGDHTPPTGWPTGGLPIGTPVPTPATGPGARMMRPPGVPATLPPGVMTPPNTGAMGGMGGMPPTMPMHGGPMPPMQPMPPMMPPMAMMPPGFRPAPAPPKKGTPLWIWLVIGAAVLVIAGAAVAVSMQDDKDHHDGGDHHGRGSSDAPPLAGDVVPAGAYRVRLPIGFNETPGQFGEAGLETHVYSGTIEGNFVTIVVISGVEDLSSQPKSELDDGCGDIARNFLGGALVSSEMVSGKGSQMYRCTILGNEQEAEGAIYSGSGGTLVVFIASVQAAFAGLAETREELFDRRVEGP